MGESLVELYYSFLNDYDMFDTFRKWAKENKLLPKRRWFRKRNFEEEEQIILEAILKFAQTDIPPQALKEDIWLYS